MSDTAVTKKKKELTPEEKKNIRSLWWRSGMVMSSTSPYKRQGQGYCFSMIPIINQLYKNDEKGRIDALCRAQEFINTHFCSLGFILGLNYALEKEKVEKGTIGGDVIRNVRATLMGPLAGIGDSIFFTTIRVIAAGIAISFSNQGSILGMLLFILIYGGSFMLLKYPLVKQGYLLGTNFLEDLFQKGIIKSITKGANILGLIMVGCMSASLIIVSTKLTFDINGAKTQLQTLFDGIMPGLLPLLTLLAVWFFLKKKISIVKITFGILFFCIIMAFLGIF
jgi:mannose/fructose/N-acetylgalactosamine-specific phosphotransferase system component IID